MVDWTLARRVAALAGATDGPRTVGVDVAEAARRLEPHVSGYTGLHPAGGTPPAEVVDRAGWADANLTTFSHILDPVADRRSDRPARARPVAGPPPAGSGPRV